MTMTDHDLLILHRHENTPDALRELVNRHIDMVHATARHQLRDPHLADDATQAVFLLLVRRAKSLPPDTIIAGWLFKATCNIAREIHRQNSRRQRREREANAMPTPNEPAFRAMAEEDRAVLHEAIARLPGTDRSAIVLHYLEGRSSAEVAAAIGASETAVRTRLFRAKDRLRTLLGRAGISITAAALAAFLETSKAHAAPAAILAQAHAIVQGTAPAASVQALVKGVLQMTLRTKQITLAGIVLMVAFFLGLLAMSLTSPANGKPATPATPASTQTAPAATSSSMPGAPLAIAQRMTPKDAVLGAYHDALAGNEDAFLAHFGGLSDDRKTIPPTDDQKSVLRAVVRVMHAFDQLLQAVGEKFGADARDGLAQRVPMQTVPDDVANSTVQMIDDDHAMVDIGNSGPGKVPVVRVGDTWLVDPAVLATLNAAAANDTEKKIDQINALTVAVRAGQFPDSASFSAAIAQVLQQKP